MIEGDESFSAEIAVSAPTDGAPIAAGPAATVTITDDDSATLALAIGTAKVAEGGSFSLTVSLGHTPEGGSTTAKTLPADLALTVTPTFATAADGKAAAADMTDSTAKTVTLSAGSSTATVSFAIADDTADEPDETLGFRLALAPSQTLPDDVTLGTASVDATIEDGDATLVTAENVTVAEGAGNATLTLSITRPAGETRAVSGTVTPSFKAGDRHGEADDYTSTSAVSFTIASGASTTTVAIPIAQDDVIEGDESFSAEIAVSAPTDGAPIAAGPAATVTITDDDSATLALAIGTAKVAEGGSFSLTVSLGHTPEGGSTTAKTLPADLALTVTPTFATAADGKAAAADMTDSTAKTVTLSAGSSTATVSFAIADDTADEPDETLGFRLALAPSQTLPDDVTLGTASVDATIEDGDATLVTAENVTVAEGAGNATLTLSITRPAGETRAVSGTVTPSFKAGDRHGGPTTTPARAPSASPSPRAPAPPPSPSRSPRTT